MEKLVCIILMAGLSTRFGGPKNKQLCLLKGKRIFEYAIDAFSSFKDFDQIVITVNKDNRPEIEQYIDEKSINAKVILGGKTRQESVDCALSSLTLNGDDIVVIHDGARPLVNNKIIKDVIKAAKKVGASTTYIPATDTIAVKNKSDEVVEFLPRPALAQIQTPQAFKFSVITEAHKSASNTLTTDDCSLVLALNKKVKLVEGSKLLHKVTTSEDILYLEGLLK